MYNNCSKRVKRAMVATGAALGLLALSGAVWVRGALADSAAERGCDLYGVSASQRLRAAQLKPAPTQAECQVAFELTNMRLAGIPPHVLSLRLAVVMDAPAHVEAAKALEDGLQDFASQRVAEMTYSDLASLSAKWRLRDSLLLWLNEHLPPEACAREIYVTFNRLQ